MPEDKELEKLRTLAETLNEKVGSLELSLISFCDAYKKNLLKMGKNLIENTETVKDLASLTLYVNGLQSEFTTFKTNLSVALFTITEH
mgnify:CR=1 FL=1